MVAFEEGKDKNKGGNGGPAENTEPEYRRHPDFIENDKVPENKRRMVPGTGGHNAIMTVAKNEGTGDYKSVSHIYIKPSGRDDAINTELMLTDLEKETKVISTFHFKHDQFSKDNITDLQKVPATAQAIINDMVKSKDIVVVLEANTDKTGDEKYNMGLSKNRGKTMDVLLTEEVNNRLDHMIATEKDANKKEILVNLKENLDVRMYTESVFNGEGKVEEQRIKETITLINKNNDQFISKEEFAQIEAKLGKIDNVKFNDQGFAPLENVIKEAIDGKSETNRNVTVKVINQMDSYHLRPIHIDDNARDALSDDKFTIKLQSGEDANKTFPGILGKDSVVTLSEPTAQIFFEAKNLNRPPLNITVTLDDTDNFAALVKVDDPSRVNYDVVNGKLKVYQDKHLVGVVTYMTADGQEQYLMDKTTVNVGIRDSEGHHTMLTQTLTYRAKSIERSISEEVSDKLEFLQDVSANKDKIKSAAGLEQTLEDGLQKFSKENIAKELALLQKEAGEKGLDEKKVLKEFYEDVNKRIDKYYDQVSEKIGSEVKLSTDPALKNIANEIAEIKYEHKENQVMAVIKVADKDENRSIDKNEMKDIIAKLGKVDGIKFDKEGYVSIDDVVDQYVGKKPKELDNTLAKK